MDSVFTKIIKKEISSFTVYEDSNVIAFLDIKPVKMGHTLVVPKKQIDYIFDLDSENNKLDIAFIDTAGRLQNKKNLMEEYRKIFTVLKKINPEYPHETILVLDATTGQNAINQVEEFKKISNLTGLIITKLDTSAKGGILLAICKRFGLPIIAVGMGEKETDLHPFNSADFSKILIKN